MSGIFHKDCACGTVLSRAARIECYDTDREAVSAAYAHWMRRFQDDGHRYWSVHGPSGHVIGVHDSPVGELPPRPV